MGSDTIDPQSMTNSQIQYCKNCGKRVSETDKFCPNCKADLSKVGRNISLSLSDSINVSDKVFVKIIKQGVPLKWEANDLALVGIFFTLAVGITPLLDELFKNLIFSLIGAFILTFLLLFVLTRVKIVRESTIKFFRWFLK